MQPSTPTPQSPPSLNRSDASPPADAPDNLTPNIVENIPVRAQTSSAAINEGADLDKIMQDVGKELKKEDKKPHKAGFLRFKRKPKTETHTQQAPSLVRSAPMSVPTASPKPTSQPAAKAPLPKAAAKPKPQRSSSAPVLVITLTIIVTGALIAAAFYAYKK